MATEAAMESSDESSAPSRTGTGTRSPPRGPPPPQPIQALAPLSHRLSSAIGQALRESGLDPQWVLTHVPWDWQQFTSVTVRIEHLRHNDQVHPNILFVGDDVDTIGPDAPSSSAAIAVQMEAEGRARMTAAEMDMSTQRLPLRLRLRRPPLRRPLLRAAYHCPQDHHQDGEDRNGGAYYKGVWREHQWFRPVETYATDVALDICVLQETRWAYDANWSTPDFHFIHSAGAASEDKVGGLLTMVSTRLAKSSEIQFHAAHPGRLLHVRINRSHPIDVMNVYQYTANDHKLTPARRQQFLTKLQKTLRGESEDLMAILSAFALTVLNTWNRSSAVSGALADLRQQVQQKLAAQSWTSLQQLEEGITDIATKLYPVSPVGTSDEAVRQDLHDRARHMWGLFRSMRSQKFTAQGVVTAWRLWAQFVQAHRAHKRKAKAKSKAYKQDLLDTAQQAARRGDMHQVWKVVHTLAPKVRRKPLQLYRDGHIMTPEAELDWIIEAFGERYGARAPPQTTRARQFPPVQVSEAEVWHQLEHLPVRKAVPRSAAPSVLWRACSSEIAHFITQQFNLQWQQPDLQVEQDWADASVALLPKPKGKNDKPLEWRPIGLQHPIGKGLMKILITRAKALELAQIDPSIQEVLMQWLSQVKYIFRHKQHEKEIWPSWGLRQGCIGSPVLWSAFTALLCKAIDLRMRQSWCSDHATLYADDSHLRWTFQTVAQFEQAICELNWTFAVFRRLGMQVNREKTQAILSVTGDIRHKIQKLYVRKQDGIRRLLLSPGDPTEWIPLVDKAEYLGLIVSYEQFEWQSVRHRVVKAHKRRWALASLLHAKRVSIPYKLRLWRSCVQSSMMYALHCLCLQTGQIRYLQRAIMKHIRAITSDQAFLTGNTHEFISAKYEVQSAHDLLRQAHASELKVAGLGDWILEHDYNQAISHSLQEDITHQVQDSDEESHAWTCPVCMEQFPTTAALKIHARRKHKLVDRPAQVFDRTKHSIAGLPQCSGCLKKFSRWQTLEWHINHHACPAMKFAAEQNKTAMPTQTDTSNAQSSQPDQPLGYQAQSSEDREITTLTQPVDDASEQLPMIQRSHVQHLVEQGPNSFIRFSSYTDHMQHYCVICGQWVVSQRVMKLHFQNTHGDLYKQLSKIAKRIIDQRERPMDEDMEAFFGGVRDARHTSPFPPDPFQDYSAESQLDNGPNKRRREPFASNKHQPHSHGRSPFSHYNQAPMPTQHRDPLLHTLTKTVLRQQEELRILRQDTAFIIFLKPGQDSIMHHLYQVAVQFKARQEAEPTWSLGQFPLRMVLANALFRELIDRLNKVLASQDRLKAVMEQGWRDDKGWRFQAWNRTMRHLEHDRNRPSIPDDKLLDHLATITQCLKAVIITRFCCTRKMTETMSSPATFKMDISLRSHSALTMWDTMRALQGNAVFQLVGMGFKTESLGRGPEEQRLRDMVFGRR
ncbi:unnamed protein product [Symbiodinium sp. CCMP2456]|nr:unnamed protein product [Symbiodinium sp. CCMP2456]